MNNIVKNSVFAATFIASAVTSHLAMADTFIQAIEKPAAQPKVVTPTEDYARITIAAMKRVCELAKGENAKIVLTGKAHGACKGNAKFMPKLIKKGTRFTKARTGAEFNTLIANIAAFTK